METTIAYLSRFFFQFWMIKIIFLTHEYCKECKVDAYGRSRSSRHQPNGVVTEAEGGGIIRERSGTTIITLSDQWLHFRSCQNKGTGETRLGAFSKFCFCLSYACEW